MKKNNVEQRSDEWFFARKGRITGTTLKGLMSTQKVAREDAEYELIAERLSISTEDDEENDRDRGIRLEPEAIAAFEFETGKSVEACGFCAHDDEQFIAQSPDGLVGDTEAVEVKCLVGKYHVRAWLTNEIPDKHYWQAVQYFVVNPKLELLHFVCYNPNIPVHPLHIIEKRREELAEDIQKAAETQKVVLARINEKLQGIINF